MRDTISLPLLRLTRILTDTLRVWGQIGETLKLHYQEDPPPIKGTQVQIPILFPSRAILNIDRRVL